MPHIHVPTEPTSSEVVKDYCPNCKIIVPFQMTFIVDEDGSAHPDGLACVMCGEFLS